MKSKDIYEAVKQLERNIEFYKRENDRLEQQIEDMKNINGAPTPVDVSTLPKETYSRDEIIVAYNRMLTYEGITKRMGYLITDTFLEFLKGTHHSLKKQKDGSEESKKG
jgi:hypothetical protein